MRLGMVIYGRLAQRTGGYLYDRMLAAALRRCGDEVEIIELTDGGAVERLLHNARPAWRRRRRFDLLLQDELCFASLWAANLALRDCPKVAIVHNLNGRGRAERWTERRYLRSVDGVIANSAHTLSRVEGLIGAEPPAVVAQPALEHLRPPAAAPVTADEIAARPGGPTRLLFVGNLSPLKGLHLLLPALARSRQRRWQLRVVGSLARDPAYALACRRQIDELGLGSRVELLGDLSGPALARAYRASELMVLTSPEEGFGLAYLEAMAFGLPVVASDSGAAAEIMSDGREALLVAPEATALLSAALERLIFDADLRARLGTAGLARAAAHPNQRWQQTAERARSLLARLVN